MTDGRGAVFLETTGLTAQDFIADGPSLRSQVPWTLAPGSTFTVRAAQPGHPFEQVRSYQVQPFWPVGKAIVHQDFRGPVTPEDPARPGEVIHLYLTGLGMVQPVPPLNQPTPTGTLFRAEADYRCTYRNQGSASAESFPGETLFSGLAPGLQALFQVDLRVPGGPTSATVEVSCTTLGAGSRLDGSFPLAYAP